MSGFKALLGMAFSLVLTFIVPLHQDEADCGKVANQERCRFKDGQSISDNMLDEHGPMLASGKQEIACSCPRVAIS